MVDFEEQTFEVAVFEGRHAWLVIAELELSHEAKRVALPPWIGEEITHDQRYGNFHLAECGLTCMPLASGMHSSSIATSSLPFGRRN